jgi:hypothetical protein
MPRRHRAVVVFAVPFLSGATTYLDSEQMAEFPSGAEAHVDFAVFAA